MLKGKVVLYRLYITMVAILLFGALGNLLLFLGINVHDDHVTSADFDCLQKKAPTRFDQELLDFRVEVSTDLLSKVLRFNVLSDQTNGQSPGSYFLKPLDAEAFTWFESHQNHVVAGRLRAALIRHIFGKTVSESAGPERVTKATSPDIRMENIIPNSISNDKTWDDSLRACSIFSRLTTVELNELRQLNTEAEKNATQVQNSYFSQRAWVNGNYRYAKWGRWPQQLLLGEFMVGTLAILVSLKHWLTWLLG